MRTLNSLLTVLASGAKPASSAIVKTLTPTAPASAATVVKGPKTPPTKQAPAVAAKTTTVAETDDERIERRARELLAAQSAENQAKIAEKNAKAEAAAARFNPFCVAKAIVLGTIKPGDVFYVIAEHKIRRATFESRSGWICKMVVDGVADKLDLSVSFIFPTVEAARQAISFANKIANTNLTDVDPAKDAGTYDDTTKTHNGRKVAVFSVASDYGIDRNGASTGVGYFMGYVDKTYATKPGHLCTVYFGDTMDDTCDAVHLFDPRTVTDPFCAQYALRRSVDAFAAAQQALATSEVVDSTVVKTEEPKKAPPAKPTAKVAAAGKDMTLDRKAGKVGPLPEGKAAMAALKAPTPATETVPAAATAKKPPARKTTK